MANAIPTELVEEWRPVVGYVGVYEVSNLGRIRRLARDLVDTFARSHKSSGTRSIR